MARNLGTAQLIASPKSSFCHILKLIPIAYSLVFTEVHFQTIAINTNKYAEIKRVGIERICLWKLTCVAEIKFLVAIV